MGYIQKLIFVSFLAGLFMQVTTTLHAQEKVNWMSFEEMTEKQRTEPRKVFIDIYTDWCGWCKKMDKAAFSKPEIAAYLNANYYSVKFDAEQKGSLKWQDKTFEFVPGRRTGYHQLAFELTRGKLSYPTITFLDENSDIIQSIPGYRTSEEFDMIIHYFGEDAHKSTSWKNYSKTYEGTMQQPGVKKMGQPVKFKRNNK